MSQRLALDSNAAVDFLRTDRAEPPLISTASEIFLPLPVLGELYVGAFVSQRKEKNLAAVEELAQDWTLLYPDRLTARVYGELGSSKRVQRRSSPKRERARKNDLWIAALCLQHKIPLLTNDPDFDQVAGLEVIHW